MNSHHHLPDNIIVHEEVHDIVPIVNEQDIIAYSQRLGIDLVKNPSLTTLIKNLILQPLPHNWFPCLDTRTGQWFYSNALNGESTWIHPLEDIHRALANEYCCPLSNASFERGTPEGESAEPSMELGIGTKDPVNGESSTNSSFGSRNLLPRILAPLKRSGKSDTVPLSSKSVLSPITPRDSVGEANGSFEDTSLSTFKASNPIRSLLPNDILFENRSRSTSVPPINSRIIPPISVIEGSRDSKLSERSSLNSLGSLTPIQNDKSSLLLAYEKDLLSTKNIVTSDFTSKNDPQAESSRVNSAKPGLSFTERLAAKKASRNKVTTEIPNSLTNPKVLPKDVTSSFEKKRVQFDMNKDEIRHYTPENSEEHQVQEKSESSSSDDLLGLVGDPGDLKPFMDLSVHTSAFEEKRWDVKLTSFGVSSAETTPVKMSTTLSDHTLHKKDVGEDEMVTAFTSEYCPSPLPAKPTEHETTHSTECATMFIEESISSADDARAGNESVVLEPVLELDILTNIPSPKTTNENPVNPKSQSMPDISSTSATLIDVPVKDGEDSFFHPNISESKLENVNTIDCLEVQAKNQPCNEVDNSNQTTTEVIPQANETDSVRLVESPKTRKLKRSITRSNSFESSVASVQSDFVILPNQVCLPAPQLKNELENEESHESPSKSCEIKSNCHKNADFMSSQKTAVIISEPTNISSSTSVPVSENGIGEGKISLSNEEGTVPVTRHEPNSEAAPITTHEEWLRMRKEMESVMENEKARLENWFKKEIEQIKCQFEKELASERERTECLSKLVENTKSEKDEAAKMELMRLQESLTKLVEEKTRQVQIRMDGETIKPASVLNPPHGKQDALVQTERDVEKPKSTKEVINTVASKDVQNVSCSHRETQVSPIPRKDSWMKCQCDSLQKQVARVEREMQLLKQKNLSFQKPIPSKRRNTPIKAQRESWWIDSDDSSTSTISSSYSELRPARNRRSRSMSNLHAERRSHSNRKSKHTDRARDALLRIHTPRRAQWLEDISPDQSTDTLTSGVSSTLSTAGGEWDSVLNSIHKISDDIHEVWSHIGRRQRPLSCLPNLRFSDSSRTYASTPLYPASRVPLHCSLNGSTAERTQALKLWLQQNNSYHSQLLLCKSDQQ